MTEKPIDRGFVDIICYWRDTTYLNSEMYWPEHYVKLPSIASSRKYFIAPLGFLVNRRVR